MTLRMNKLLKSLLTVILTMALMGLPVLIHEAQAQKGRRGGGGGREGGAKISGGGGGFKGGGMGGGSFEGVSRPKPPPRPSQPIQPGRPSRPSGEYRRDVSVTRDVRVTRDVNVKVDHGWRHDYWGGVAAGVAGAVAVGSVVYAISSAARPVVYSGTTYYVDGDTYYKKCYQGDEVAYCIVENPNP